MLGYLYYCVGGDPTRNAYNERVKALLLKSRYCRVYLSLLVVVRYGEYADEVKSLFLKSSLCSGAFSDYYVNGGIYLTEANKSYFCHVVFHLSVIKH